MKVVLLILLLLVFEGQVSRAGKKKKVKGSAAKKTNSLFVGKLNALLCVEYEKRPHKKLTPKEAIKVCEDDVQCAGFSYQGAKNLEQKFSMKFFHYIPEEAVSGAKSSRSDWTWTSYKVSRTYVLLNLREEDAKKDELADSQEKVEFFNALNPAEKFNINLQNFDLQRCLDKKATKSKWMMKTIVNESTWTAMQPTNGNNAVVKRQNVAKMLHKAHLRATIHDRSALALRKMIVNGEDLTPLGTEEDLATKLGLRRSPQLFLDFYQKGQRSLLANPPATSAAYFYIEGAEPMDWILIPTNAGSELAKLNCKPEEILSPDLTIHNSKIQRGILHQGEMIYVPPGWAYIANTKDEKSVTVAEARMTSNAIEEAAGAMGEQEIHGLKRGLENPLWITWRRFTEILKQRKRAKK